MRDGGWRGTTDQDEVPKPKRLSLAHSIVVEVITYRQTTEKNTIVLYRPHIVSATMAPMNGVT
jgi:hypothetical protein